MSKTWTLAPSLAALFAEVNARWPKRSKRSDGTIGDPAHQARASEHNPDIVGIVRAADITVLPGKSTSQLLDAVIGDDRVHYVIHDRLIYSRANNWRPRPYSGANPHTKHVHVSIRNNTSERASAAVRAAAAADTGPWFKPDLNIDKEAGNDMTPEQLAEAILNYPIRANGVTDALAQQLATAFVQIAAQSAAVTTEAKRDRANLDALTKKLDRLANKLDAIADKLGGDK